MGITEDSYALMDAAQTLKDIAHNALAGGPLGASERKRLRETRDRIHMLVRELAGEEDD